MKRKYFFFDIDGTLTDKTTNEIVPSAKEAVKKLEQAGHFVCINTGRAHYKAEKPRLELGFDNMVCSGGNGIVLNGELIQNTPLDRENCIAVLNEAKEKGIGYLIAINDSIEVYSDNDLFRQQVGERQEPTTYFIDENFDYNKVEKFYKLYLSLDEKAEKEFKSKDLVGHLRFVKEYLIFQADNKKGGILKMMDILGGNIEDVVVFGDDYNDLDMFDNRWTCVAMGNACNELKEKATYVADKNINDGIYKICSEMNWF